jgi:cytochrome P450
MRAVDHVVTATPAVRPGSTAQVRIFRGLVTDLGTTLVGMHRRYGPVVDVGAGPFRFTYLFGAEGNEHILGSNASNFEWEPAFRLLEVVDGPTALVTSDGADHKRRRRLVQPAFAMKRVDAHLGLIVEEVDRALDGWTPGARFRAHEQLRTAVRRIVLRSLFGELLGDRADEVGELLEPGMRYIQRSPVARFDHDLRVNAYARAVRGVRAADRVIQEEVDRRRARGIDADEHPDVLSALLVGADDEQLTDAEVLDQVRSLIAAGYDTTSGAAAWIVHELGRHPEVVDRLRDEVGGVLGDRPPTLDDLRRLPTVDGVVREVLRLWPPGFVAGRRAIDDFEVAGHRVPGGTMVLYSAYVTGRDPELWPDPDRFDPGRWAPGAPEPAPYSFVPFGGGARRCIGFALATLELQVLVTRLAQRARWRLERPDTRPVGIATAVPKGGVPVTVL